MESQIRRNIFILLGVTFFVLIAMILAWFFALVRPQKEALAKKQEAYNTRKGVAGELQAALDAQTKAEENAKYAQAQLDFLRLRYRRLVFDMGESAPKDRPDLSNAIRNQTWRRNMNELYSEYGLALQQELRNAANDTNVVIGANLSVNAPPRVPEEIVVPNGFIKPLRENGGSLGVGIVGSFPDILRFFDRINLSSILMTVGLVELNGVSPRIEAKFSVTPYLLAVGPSVKLSGGAPAPAPETGEGGAASATTGEPAAAPEEPATSGGLKGRDKEAIQ